MGHNFNEKPTQAKLKRRFLRGYSKNFSFGQFEFLFSNRWLVYSTYIIGRNSYRGEMHCHDEMR